MQVPRGEDRPPSGASDPQTNGRSQGALRLSLDKMKNPATICALILAAFHLYTAYFGLFDSIIQRSVHLGLVMFIGFLTYPLARRLQVNGVLAVGGLACAFYLVVIYEQLIARMGMATPLDFWVGILCILLVLLLGWKSLGWPLPLFCLIFLIYGLYGPYFPSFLAHTPKNQLITGTLVNAFLFLSVFKLGPWATIPIASLPSLFALSRGLLPPAMVILIPFIIMANFVLVLSFWLFSKKISLKIAILFSSFLKFLFLSLVVSFLFSKLIPPQVISMMKWPQLATALSGGVLALSLEKSLQSLQNNSSRKS